jgi:hypothetical protein
MSKEIKGINPNIENLTPEKLKSFSGFENLNDEDAKETVFAIQTFAIILYEFTNEQSKTKQQKIAA